MIARVKAMLRHLERSESTELKFLLEEQQEIESRMYKHPLWKRRTFRERGVASIRNDLDKEYWYLELEKLAKPPFHPLFI